MICSHPRNIPLSDNFMCELHKVYLISSLASLTAGPATRPFDVLTKNKNLKILFKIDRLITKNKKNLNTLKFS